MKIAIKETIVVEGRYDINTLRQIVSTPIVETRGFGIFKDNEKLKMLRKIAEKSGIVVLTDSDGAGFVIRNYLKGSLPKQQVKHAYIPDIYGKERRKRTVSKEGKLGVEGMAREVLYEALRRAGATFLEDANSSHATANPITKADLFSWGLTGTQNSAKLRQQLLHALQLPEYLSANGMIEVLNIMTNRDEVDKILSQLNY